MIDATPFRLFESFEKNPKTGQVKKRFLKFDINALADFEQETGMGFGQLMSTKALFATTRALLWAGLKHEERTLTIEQMGALLFKYIKEEGGSIDQALKAAFEAAAEQGALGKEVADRMDATDGEVVRTDPPKLEAVTRPDPAPVVTE
jgi:hypothetical protein